MNAQLEKGIMSGLAVTGALLLVAAANRFFGFENTVLAVITIYVWRAWLGK